jgi:hypothetical protein
MDPYGCLCGNAESYSEPLFDFNAVPGERAAVALTETPAEHEQMFLPQVWVQSSNCCFLQLWTSLNMYWLVWLYLVRGFSVRWHGRNGSSYHTMLIRLWLCDCEISSARGREINKDRLMYIGYNEARICHSLGRFQGGANAQSVGSTA